MARDLEHEFHQAMINIYLKAKAEAKYRATIFLDMVTTRGGLVTAKVLINSNKPSDGYTHLYERGRLDLTVEALVTENDDWKPLFSDDELKRAAKRLDEYGYKPRSKL